MVSRKRDREREVTPDNLEEFEDVSDLGEVRSDGEEEDDTAYGKSVSLALVSSCLIGCRESWSEDKAEGEQTPVK